jgi:hypothetical protein
MPKVTDSLFSPDASGLPASERGIPRAPVPSSPHETPPGVRQLWLRANSAVAHLARLVRVERRADRIFLASLLVADFVLIAVFVAYAYVEHYHIEDSVLYGNVKFSFVDGGYPELFGYGKQILITLLLLAVYARTRQAVYLGLALLFTTTGLDDSMALHEAVGNYLATNFALAERTGELVGWALLGMAPMVVVLLGYLRSDSRSRRNAEALLLAFGLLLFFAVGLDVVHGILHRHVGGFQTLMTMLEDGGELLTLTLLCALSLGIFRLEYGPRRSFALSE